MAEIKHVGRIVTTRKKCIVVYRTLPGESSSCLIVPTEHLPDSYHDSIINLVESNAGQTAYEFAEAMTRMTFPDGSTMLAALHSQKRLVKVPTNQVEMTPTLQASILLSELNQIIAEQRGVTVDELSIRPTEQRDKAEVKEVGTVQQVPTPASDVTRTTSGSVNEPEVATPVSFDSPEAEAKHYRSQADKFAKQAAEMRRKAEDLVPTKKVK
jgi:hypothetical protein